jgi:hypothetical protein
MQPVRHGREADAGASVAAMSLSEEMDARSRPLRRRLVPGRFKETYVNKALATRPHRTLYLEVGVRDGQSLRYTRADHKVGVDPQPTRAMDVLRRGEQLYRMTSDVFFDQQAPESLSLGGIDVALIDGLHEFGQALRDLLHLEPYMRADGVVILDDMNPPTAARACDVAPGGPWNGDVWKIAAFLTAERRDLRYVTIDADQGVGVVTGFTGDRTEPLWPAPDVVARYKALDYSYLASDRHGILNLDRKSVV